MQLTKRTAGPRQTVAALLCAAALYSGTACAAEPAPAPSKHQLMKDCMAKQKASNSGKRKEDLKSACKDIAATEKENADADKKQAEKPAPPAN